jgi:hypothetical protein
LVPEVPPLRIVRSVRAPEKHFEERRHPLGQACSRLVPRQSDFFLDRATERLVRLGLNADGELSLWSFRRQPEVVVPPLAPFREEGNELRAALDEPTPESQAT